MTRLAKDCECDGLMLSGLKGALVFGSQFLMVLRLPEKEPSRYTRKRLGMCAHLTPAARHLIPRFCEGQKVPQRPKPKKFKVTKK